MPATRSQGKSGPEAGPQTLHHTPDGRDQVPASAGARSESSAASAASPWEKVAEWVGKLGSDRKQSSKKAEWDASVRPATIADPRGSDVSDISAETSGSAETTDAVGAVARPRSSDDGRASYASVNDDAVSSRGHGTDAPSNTHRSG